jgi:hypothetical protein
MDTTIEYFQNETQKQRQVNQHWWQRLTLLTVLGYEGAGCLLGASLLIIAPDGRLMDMPVNIMHGAFPDFLIPGIILFGLGILNTLAFVSVMRKTNADWFMAGLAMGGLLIWFIVEIIILQELHWLHLMWGVPVLLGWVVTIPLIALRHNTPTMQRALLGCGILSTLWYLAINIFVPMLYEGYSVVSVTPSELSAIGAPTRITWVLLSIFYPLLFAAFGWGVWQLPLASRALKVVGILAIIYSIWNLYWPPMHQREVIAAGGGTLTDTLHIVWAMMTLLLMMLMMGFGAAAMGKKFRLYTIVTWLIFMVFGSLTWMESPGIEANLPTPRIGLWERINIAAFMSWVAVLALVLLRKGKSIIPKP